MCVSEFLFVLCFPHFAFVSAFFRKFAFSISFSFLFSSFTYWQCRFVALLNEKFYFSVKQRLNTIYWSNIHQRMKTNPNAASGEGNWCTSVATFAVPIWLQILRIQAIFAQYRTILFYFVHIVKRTSYDVHCTYKNVIFRLVIRCRWTWTCRINEDRDEKTEIKKKECEREEETKGKHTPSLDSHGNAEQPCAILDRNKKTSGNCDDTY